MAVCDGHQSLIVGKGQVSTQHSPPTHMGTGCGVDNENKNEHNRTWYTVKSIMKMTQYGICTEQTR